MQEKKSELQKRIEELNQFRKEERKFKAEQHILILKEKSKINQAVNWSSL